MGEFQSGGGKEGEMYMATTTVPLLRLFLWVVIELGKGEVIILKYQCEKCIFIPLSLRKYNYHTSSSGSHAKWFSVLFIFFNEVHNFLKFVSIFTFCKLLHIHTVPRPPVEVPSLPLTQTALRAFQPTSPLLSLESTHTVQHCLIHLTFSFSAQKSPMVPSLCTILKSPIVLTFYMKSSNKWAHLTFSFMTNEKQKGTVIPCKRLHKWIWNQSLFQLNDKF